MEPLAPPREGGGNRKSRFAVDFPEPSLWNSPFGRRAFLKRTGAATAATAIALHGFRMEVLASESDCPYEDRITKYRVYLTNNTGSTQWLSGDGSSTTSADNAHLAAAINLISNAKNSGYLNPDGPNGGDSPQKTYMCKRAVISSTTVKILPQNAGSQPVTTAGSNQTGFHEHIDFPVYAGGQTVLVVDIAYSNTTC